jgi:hypothetical protein
MERDFEANPYTPHEERVAKYLCEVTGIGAGDDPVEFLIASHESLRRRIEYLQAYINRIEGED